MAQPTPDQNFYHPHPHPHAHPHPQLQLPPQFRNPFDLFFDERTGAINYNYIQPYGDVKNAKIKIVQKLKIYFAFSSLILLIYVIDEREYLVGEHSKPKGETIIEKGDITKTHVIFNIIVLICSIGLVASSILMMYGLKKNKREYLLPWILLLVGDVLAELFYAIYFLFSKRANFDPIVGFIFTMDLFIVCLNTYCLLCVISQYQEYKNGMNCRNREINFIVSIQSSNDLLDKATMTDIPSQLQNTSQLHRSTQFLITSNQCSAISAIPEEDAMTETHL